MAILEEQIGAAYDAHLAGRRHDAERQYRALLSMHPSQVDTLFLLSSLISESSPDEALDLARQALAASAGKGGMGVDEATLLDHGAACLSQRGVEPELESEWLATAQQLDPSGVDRLFRLAEAQRRAGEEVDAMASLRAYLEMRADDVNARSNLGTLQLQFGNIEAAIGTLRQVLAFQPHHVNALNNLGNAYSKLGQLELAVEQYQAAVKTAPGFVEGWSNLAAALCRLNRGEDSIRSALSAVLRSIEIKPTIEAKRFFVEICNKINPAFSDLSLVPVVTTALLEPWGRPVSLIPFASRLLKADPALGQAIDRLMGDADQIKHDEVFPGSFLNEAADSFPLLCAMLSSGPIDDSVWEAVLTALRRHLLKLSASALVKEGMADDLPGLFCALAQQCFINEYVYFQTPEEIKVSEDLRDRLTDALKDDQFIPAIWVITVACYFPLYSISGAHGLLERRCSERVRDVLKQQIQEPIEELHLRSEIPRLTSVEHQVSLAVQSQYEEHPYPRWVRLPGESNKRFLNSYIQSKFPSAGFRRLADDRNPEILVAGCGTGQHSIETAQLYRGDRNILAVDLSMASLAYAKRKTIELGIGSIDYGQADLLKLESLGRDFDVIESVGVLHHLEDPFEGWKVLLSMLRSNGLMMLGFYSSLARRDIVRVRNLIRQESVGSSSRDIRNFRQTLFKSKGSEDYGLATGNVDFFSISSCRDLLFHVQEHRMNLEVIANFLKNNDLNFLGFEIEESVIQAYKKRHPGDSSATNLDYWRAYEEDNPDTFCQMYQFWIQKNH